MIIVNFFKKYVSHFLAILANLLVYAFLFAPFIIYTIEGAEGTKSFSLNIFQLMGNNIGHSWAWIVIFVSFLVSTQVIVVIGIFKNFDKVKEILVTIQLLLLSLLSCFLFISKEMFNWVSADVIANYDSCMIGWGFAVVIVLMGLQILFCVSFVSFANGGLKVLVENAMLVALAFILSFVKLFSMPTGGSINFQMLPLMILAIRRGPLSGFLFGGIVYGLLTCFTDGYGFQSFPFDYLVGFGSVAILGLFKPLIMGMDIKPKKNKIKNEELPDELPTPEKKQLPNVIKGELFILIGGLLATFVRFVGGVSSTLAFWAPGNFAYALTYNAPYIFISGAMSIAVLMIIYPLLRKLR